MKLIGRSEDRQEPIVQLTRDEYSLLMSLQNAAAGASLPQWHVDYPQNDGDDVSAALTAIKEWVMLKFKLNELKDQIEYLERTLNDENS